jgi:hypothetical protein
VTEGNCGFGAGLRPLPVRCCLHAFTCMKPCLRATGLPLLMYGWVSCNTFHLPSRQNGFIIAGGAIFHRDITFSNDELSSVCARFRTQVGGVHKRPLVPKMSAALAFPRRRQRLGRIAEHIVVSAAAATATIMPTDDSAPVAIGQNEVEAARDEYKEGLKGRPRVELDVAAWSATELIQRGLALGASAAAIDVCVDSTDSVARLVKLVRSLEPPPPQSVTADDLTVPNTTPVAELVERLNTYGAVIIENAADEATIAEVEGALAAVEAFDQPQEGGMLGRMWMDSLVKAPAVAKLVTHPLVLETGKQLLGPLW